MGRVNASVGAIPLTPAVSDSGVITGALLSASAGTVTAAAGAVAHGDSYTITGSGFGTKSDNNDLSVSFQGAQHIALRATDLDEASQLLPASETVSGWQSHTGGVYPMLVDEDLLASSQLATYGHFISQTGGPGQSGRYFGRNVANSRLPNWNLTATDITTDYMYVSLHYSQSDQPGKMFRQYHQNDTGNFFLNWQTGTGIRINGEGVNTGARTVFGSSPNPDIDPTENWKRLEIHQDFTNSVVRLYLDNQPVTTTYTEFPGTPAAFTNLVRSGQTIRNMLLGNTPEIGSSIAFALVYADNSRKRVELADSAVWENRTKSIWQAPVSWADTSIGIRINNGDMTSGTRYLHVMDGETSIHSEAVEIT